VAAFIPQVAPPSGPYPIIELKYWAKGNAPGVFILQEESGRAEYVGSSPSDVRQAIAEAARRTDARQFLVEYAFTEARMYFLCCVFFHMLGLEDRQAHPVSGRGDLRCPVPGCPSH
jgi:hypothetical protein